MDSLDFESCERASLGSSCRNADFSGLCGESDLAGGAFGAGEKKKRKKKSPIVQKGMEANLDVSTLFIVKCFAHIKKCSA